MEAVAIPPHTLQMHLFVETAKMEFILTLKPVTPHIIALSQVIEALMTVIFLFFFLSFFLRMVISKSMQVLLQLR